MRTTLKDIATRVGVSKSLVSMYLNNHKLSAKIASDTKSRIDEAVKELNYRPSFTAKALSNGKTRTIGMICGGITNPYFSHMVEDALDEAAKHGYQLMLSLTRWVQEEEEACFENLIQRQIDGIICGLHLRTDTRLYSTLLTSKIPICRLDAWSENFMNFNIERKEAVARAIAFLAARGHRTITGHFYKESNWPSSFLQACEINQVTPTLHYTPLQYPKHISETVAEILEGRPTALLINGFEVITPLINTIHTTMPDYHPEIIVGCDDYTPMPVDPLIVGGIHASTPRQIRRTVNVLIEAIENPELNRRTLELFPSEFITAQQL